MSHPSTDLLRLHSNKQGDLMLSYSMEMDYNIEFKLTTHKLIIIRINQHLIRILPPCQHYQEQLCPSIALSFYLFNSATCVIAHF